MDSSFLKSSDMLLFIISTFLIFNPTCKMKCYTSFVNSSLLYLLN